MGLATFCSRILGLVRELLLASYFGASGMTDAFFVAYRIPNLLRDLFAEGAFSAAFVPVFTQTKVQKGEARALEVFKATFWSLFVITLFLSILIYLFAPQLVLAFAPDFADNPEKFQFTILMVKIVSPFLLFISVAALFMGVLNTYQVFFLPAITPAFLNLAVIASILFLSPLLSQWGYEPIFCLAIGIMIGGFLQMLLQYPKLKSFGYVIGLPKKLITIEVKSILHKMGPGLLGFSLAQFNFWVVTRLATSSIEGALSFISYAFRIFQFPIGILAVSLGNSHLVHFSNHWKQGEIQEANDLFTKTFFYTLFIFIPVTVFSFYYSHWLIHIVFERGAFNSHDVAMTSKAFALYTIGLPFYGLYKLTVPIFYTIDRQKIPVLTSALAVTVNVILAVSLIDKYGFAILAFSSSVSIIINCLIQIIYLKKILEIKAHLLVNLKILKLLLAAVGMYLVAQKLSPEYQVFSSSGLGQKFVILGSMCAVSFSVYFAILMALGERQLVRAVLKKFKK